MAPAPLPQINCFYREPIRIYNDHRDRVENSNHNSENNTANIVYRIEYYSLLDNNGNPEPEASRSANYLSSNQCVVQHIIDNSKSLLSKKFGIHHVRGVVFYRNGNIVDYMEGFSFGTFLNKLKDMHSKQPNLPPLQKSQQQNDYSSDGCGCTIL